MSDWMSNSFTFSNSLKTHPPAPESSLKRKSHRQLASKAKRFKPSTDDTSLLQDTSIVEIFTKGIMSIYDDLESHRLTVPSTTDVDPLKVNVKVKAIL